MSLISGVQTEDRIPEATGTQGEPDIGSGHGGSPEVIFVMGSTGAGKSTFIKYATGADVKIGSALDSCTREVGICRIPNTPIYLVDTPGFDDAYRDNVEILNDTAGCLSRYLGDHASLSGVIYVQDITRLRVIGSAMKSLQMLMKVLEDKYMSKCVLITTKWSLQPQTTSRERHQELQTNESFWKLLMERGATIAQFEDSKESAMRIIRPLTGSQSFIPQLTDEYVTKGNTQVGTPAGQEAIENIDFGHAIEIAQIRKEQEEALPEKNAYLAAMRTAELIRLERARAASKPQRRDLAINFQEQNFLRERNQEVKRSKAGSWIKTAIPAAAGGAASILTLGLAAPAAAFLIGGVRTGAVWREDSNDEESAAQSQPRHPDIFTKKNGLPELGDVYSPDASFSVPIHTRFWQDVKPSSFSARGPATADAKSQQITKASEYVPIITPKIRAEFVPKPSKPLSESLPSCDAVSKGLTKDQMQSPTKSNTASLSTSMISSITPTNIPITSMSSQADQTFCNNKGEISAHVEAATPSDSESSSDLDALTDESEQSGESNLELGSPLKQRLISVFMEAFYRRFNCHEPAAYKSHETPDRSCKGGNSESTKNHSATGPSRAQRQKRCRIEHHGSDPADKDEGDDDDDNDGDGGKKPPKMPKQATMFSETPNKRRLACPFYKYNPRKYKLNNSTGDATYQTCGGGPGFKSVARVKEHLYRRHSAPIHCPRCWVTFKLENDLVNHVNKEERCESRSNTLEGIPASKIVKLKSRKKAFPNQTEVDSWNEMYHVLFPDAPLPSPYYLEYFAPADERSTESNSTLQFRDYLQSTLPTLFREEIERLIDEHSAPMEEKLKSAFIASLRNCQERAFRDWKAVNEADCSSDREIPPPFLDAPNNPFASGNFDLETALEESWEADLKTNGPTFDNPCSTDYIQYSTVEQLPSNVVESHSMLASLDKGNVAAASEPEPNNQTSNAFVNANGFDADSTPFSPSQPFFDTGSDIDDLFWSINPSGGQELDPGLSEGWEELSKKGADSASSAT